jgi:hypothetical protein
MAGSILDVWLSPPSGVSCNTTLATGTGSETLTLGACSTGNGPVTFNGQSYGSVTATPLEVAVGGFAGNETGSFSTGITIDANAQYDGSFEAVGGSGPAFLEFDVQAIAVDVFEDFAMASDGINFQVGFTQQGHFMVPVTFGDPVNYSLSVSHVFYSFDDPEAMVAEIGIDNLEVVDANGAPIAGASVGGEIRTAEVPEPGSAALLGIGAGLLILGGWLKRWSRERGSNS